MRIAALFRLPKHRREEQHGHDRAMELLRFMGIHRKADELAANLSYGDQRRLEIARAMATVVLNHEEDCGTAPFN